MLDQHRFSHEDEVRAHADVIEGMGELENVDRAALRLIYWHGRTHAQIAAELGVPVTAVHTAVARGMRRLAGHVTDRWPARH